MAQKKNAVGWFEIPVANMKRSMAFYESAFGYKLDKPIEMMGFEMSFFPMDSTAAGASGSLIRGEGYTPSHEGALVYFSVDNIEETEIKIVKNKGKVYKPKFSIGQHGFISICEDAEGNRIALHSMN